MAQRSGCLFGLLGLGGGQRALTAGPKLPALVGTQFAVEDRTAVANAHRAGERCLALLDRDDVGVSPVAVADVRAEVVALVEKVHALGRTLADGRGWLAKNTADGLARERADKELALLEADLDGRRAIEASLAALDARISRHTDVRRQVGRLAEELARSAAHLEAVEARVQRIALGSPDDAAPAAVVGEVRAQQAAVDAVIEAYARTLRELS